MYTTNLFTLVLHFIGLQSSKNKVKVSITDATTTFTIHDIDESNTLWFQYDKRTKELYISVKNNDTWTNNVKLATFSLFKNINFPHQTLFHQ